MRNCSWLLGPTKLLDTPHNEEDDIQFPLVEPDKDKELRPTVITFKTCASPNYSGFGITHWFKRLSDWNRLVETISCSKRFLRSYKRQNNRTILPKTVESYQKGERFIIHSVQHEVYKDEINCIKLQSPLPKRSPIADLNPFLDQNDLLRVGGRIAKSDLRIQEKYPIIIPGRHHIATLLVRHHHEKIRHQGRHFTDGAIRSAGLWITGAKRLISSIIHKCVHCRKLRGKTEYQKMTDLPEDRLDPSPPFTNVGVDAFGPWSVISRRTRGGHANSKRWAILFTCLVTRAVHIELVEEMSSSAFNNALRRFTAIRGPVKIFRSDRGTNFIGAMDDLRIDSINVEDDPLKGFLYNSGTVWKFNPPHSSHMGGSWECMIGVARRILDSMLSNISQKVLPHDVLNTFMAEVSAIINSRPIVPVSFDPDFPLILTPTILLTQKSEYVYNSDALGEFCDKGLCRTEWKRAQALACVFWSRWRKENLALLQPRRKWLEDRMDIKNGDIVLLKDKNICRSQWPLGIVVNAIPGSDNHVRKAEVRVNVDGK